KKTPSVIQLKDDHYNKVPKIHMELHLLGFDAVQSIDRTEGDSRHFLLDFMLGAGSFSCVRTLFAYGETRRVTNTRRDFGLDATASCTLAPQYHAMLRQVHGHTKLHIFENGA
ncbi:hypothetical protein ACJX0J_005313, partial [Zea mays]